MLDELEYKQQYSNLSNVILEDILTKSGLP